MTCVSTPACACAVRMGQSRPGLLSTATRQSRWLSQGLLLPATFRPYLARPCKGLAQVPGPVAAASVKAGRLALVVEPFATMLPGVFLYYPGRRQIMPKLRAFIDHVRRRSDAAQKARISYCWATKQSPQENLMF